MNEIYAYVSESNVTRGGNNHGYNIRISPENKNIRHNEIKISMKTEYNDEFSRLITRLLNETGYTISSAKKIDKGKNYEINLEVYAKNLNEKQLIKDIRLIEKIINDETNKEIKEKLNYLV